MKIVQQLSITQRLVSLLGIAALGTAVMVMFLSQANQDANTKVAKVSEDLSKNSIDLSQLVSRFKTK